MPEKNTANLQDLLKSETSQSTKRFAGQEREGKCPVGLIKGGYPLVAL